MKLLITGAGGFLGKGLISALENHHVLRLMDIAPFETSHEKVIGSVAEPECVRRAVEGMEGIVIAHMAPNRPEIYADPVVPFDVNVKGTANLFAAAVEHRCCQRIVLISSTTVVGGAQRNGEFLTNETPPQPTTLYALTKACQESIAQFYSRAHGVPVVVLRPAYVLDADSLEDKYGRTPTSVNWQFIDRRDIGKAVHLALKLPEVKFELFHVLGPPDASSHADVQRTRDRLGWTPDFDFTSTR